jgi:hypothetical protein
MTIAITQRFVREQFFLQRWPRTSNDWYGSSARIGGELPKGVILDAVKTKAFRRIAIAAVTVIWGNNEKTPACSLPDHAR